MNKTYNDIVNSIAKIIIAGVNPDKIILFGSLAGGETSKDSDIDLLVIKSSAQRRDERDLEIRKLLSKVVFPMDIFVYTPEEVKEFREKPGSFIKNILDTGRILYESK